MSIACELGYLSMIDALGAERRALMEREGRSGETGFLCEAPIEPEKREPGDAPRRADESDRE
jgi:hypothetical protein